MGRFARVVAVGVAHHVTQRGNAKRYILDTDADRMVYLGLLLENIKRHGASLLGYCLMSNHVHLVMIPEEANSLALSLKNTHGRYASYWNARHRSSGHLWQGRFYSCPLDRAHLWKALRYTELNPLRAGLVSDASVWSWSSAAVHCGVASPTVDLAVELWAEYWSPATWKAYLDAGETDEELKAIRQCTHTGRPLGEESFVRDLEEATQRSLSPKTGGRPAKSEGDSRQCMLFLEP